MHRWRTIQENHEEEIVQWKKSSVYFEIVVECSPILSSEHYSSSRLEAWKHVVGDQQRRQYYQIDWFRNQQDILWKQKHDLEVRNSLLHSSWSSLKKLQWEMWYLELWRYFVHHVMWISSIQWQQQERNNAESSVRKIQTEWTRMEKCIERCERTDQEIVDLR